MQIGLVDRGEVGYGNIVAHIELNVVVEAAKSARGRKSIFAPGETRRTKINPIQMAAGIRDADGQLSFLARLHRIGEVGLKRQFGHDAVTAQFAIAINFGTQACAANGNDDALAGFEFGNLNFPPPPRNAQIISIFKRCARAALGFVVCVGSRAELSPEMFLDRGGKR